GTYSPQELYSHSFSGVGENVPDENTVKKIIASLDKKNRWLVKHVRISNPYIGDGTKTEPADEFATTFVGDETDTSPYNDPGEQEYIEIKTFVNNMKTLLNYVANSR
ncbi:MAG: hypothetical protein KAU83_08495, partial [Bacteroidales bacterium]|nr:hypothetical protein [Bacteroidales bacterium]